LAECIGFNDCERVFLRHAFSWHTIRRFGD
jgi:hypothetical protein